MFSKVSEPDFVRGEHEVLRFWRDQAIFAKLREKNAASPKTWSFLDGPITANNPMGVHHAWGRTYKDVFQRFFAMTGHRQRYQNGFDCQGLWVEVEVEKELKLGTKKAIEEFGIDRFVNECKRRVLRFAARQTEQSIRLGYWMEWDIPDELRKLAEAVGTDTTVTLTTPRGQQVQGKAHELVAKLGNPEWGGSYFTFSTENNETIWTFLKKCFTRGKVYRGHDVMPWSGRAGSAYSQMEVADGRRLTTHRACFVRFPIVEKGPGLRGQGSGQTEPSPPAPPGGIPPAPPLGKGGPGGVAFDTTGSPSNQTSTDREYLLVWTTTPWTLTSNVACAVNPELDYVKLRAKRDGAVYYFAKDNLEYKRLDKEFKEGFGRPEWGWPNGTPKLKSLGQLFKEQGGYEIEGTLKGAEMIGWRYEGPFDDLTAQQTAHEVPSNVDAQVTNIFDYAAPGFVAFFGGTEPMYHDVWKEGGSFFWAEYQSSLLGKSFRALMEHGRLVEEAERESVEMFNDPEFADQEPEIRKWAADDSSGVQDARDTLAFNQAVVLDGALTRFRSLVADVLMAYSRTGMFRLESLGSASFEELDKVLRELGLTLRNAPTWTEFQVLESIVGRIQQTGFAPNSRLNTEERDQLTALSSWRSIDVNDGEFLGLVGEELWEKTRRFIFDLASELHDLPKRSAVQCHRVIDGGRDFKGSPNVVAGEGTGIVHIAPGCGDIDHQIGQQLGLVEIAPLAEDGTFLDGFGDFTGRNSIDPATAQLVFDKLKEKQLLVYVEDYPHIYPHCWRTGDELVFRLVDEWFINMDWRDEIKAVVNEATWLPDSIDGKSREVEWLTNMRDWMVSKKRFWGLALPIWVNPNDPSEFEVVGSLKELEERARNGGEGWDEFAGNTPHRPWIDRIKLPSTKHPGQLLSRIPDVGNPWLDAGIVPFSTLNYNENYPTDLLKWDEWYPPAFVTECFPGQFRNWFYSLLALSTMMRYDETDDPKEKRPFQTLLGHRLVMNEEGKPMHKSDGTAIWFEEAAEQLGVDTMRWMYLAQNPAVDLRFGTRHPDQPVTLETVDGPISQTREGLTTYRVTSKPSDEVRRQILIPLWNSYAFFVNYARLDGFDPSLPAVPVNERPEIDRWILSNLQALTGTMRKAFAEFNTPEACRAAAAFIDDLSNWYIRRNRRRFWRSKGSGAGGQGPGQTSPSPPAPSGGIRAGWDSDKLAAYQTLYQVLVTLTKLLAPAVPFLTERMYQNLVVGEAKGSANPQARVDAPLSVHLCDYPEVDAALLDESLNRRTSAAQLLVTLAHGLREKTGHRTRQPLSELQFACASAEQRQAIETLADVVRDELNVKKVTSRDNLDDLVHYVYKPNLKTLGPKLGKMLNVVKTKLPGVDPHVLAPLRRGESVTLTFDGNEVTLAPDDVMVSTEQASDWVAADDQGIQIALSTTLTPELTREGMARDFVRNVQQARKDANLEIEDRIRVSYFTEDAAVKQAVVEWTGYIESETLAESITAAASKPNDTKDVPVGESSVALRIERA